MLYLHTYPVGEGVKEITITFKEGALNADDLKDILDYIMDEYNEVQQGKAEMEL